SIVEHHQSFDGGALSRAPARNSRRTRGRSNSTPQAIDRRDKVEFHITREAAHSVLTIEPDRTFQLIYTPIIEQDFARFGLVREKFEQHVAREVVSHQAMLKYDYVSRAIPLPEGITVFVTKQHNIITLEQLTKSPPSPDAYAAWQILCRYYYE